jgi:Nucleotidyltransferase domain
VVDRDVADHHQLPQDVYDAARQHLRVLDATAPGLVEGLYLTGSVTLGDYHPGRSDIDFMAFTSRPATDPAVVALLADVHASLRAVGNYDGSYVDRAGLPNVPDDEPEAPHVVNGKFHGTEPNHQLTPATWAEFARYAIAVRGPEPGEFGISVSRARLSQWTLGNLNGYWKTSAESGIEALRAHDGNEPIAADVVAWMALGAVRLHYTLGTGDITSKSAAGRYALNLFPAYQNVLSAALSWRATGQGDFTYSDWISCAELTIDIVADANRRWAR